MNRIIAASALIAIAAACSPADAPLPSGSDVSGPVLSYTDAFIMEPIGGRDMTMGGVTLSVAGDDVRLASASSPEIGRIEIHTMAMEDGKMRMRQVDGLDVTESAPLELKRGGNHLMMFDVSEAVVGGETVDITLNFETDGEPLTLVVEADVKVVGE